MDEGAKAVVESLTGKSKQNLEALMLADNKITSKGAVNVAKLYGETLTLKEIHLQDNEIDNEGGQAILREMKKRKLRKLEIDNNKLSGQVL